MTWNGVFPAVTTKMRPSGAVDLAAECQIEDVHAVADAEDGRHAGPQHLEHLGARHGRVGVVDAGRSAREDDAFGLEAPHHVEADVEGVDLAVDTQLAHPTRDELGVLGPEIEDEDHYSSR